MPIDNELLRRLCDNDETLTSLNLTRSEIRDEGVKLLAGVLKKNTSLTSLHLGANQIGAEGAKLLAGVLEKNTSLTLLELVNNDIGNKGVKLLAKVLEKNTSLTSLYLVDNHIGDEGAKLLAKVLEKNTSLTLLDLRVNQIGAEGARLLARVLEKNISLTLLDLGYNQIEDTVENQIDALIKRNQQYLQNLQAEVCKQLKIANILLHKAESTNSAVNHYLELPLEIKEKIVAHTNENALITNEQQRLILNYAEGKIKPVADKLAFFKATKCDRVMKSIDSNSKANEPLTKKARLI